ncbi:hypothetical protein CDD82_4508 [Ophiocordyceps australis]|uniref:DNA repair protein rad9 n=1 Tax=Ophiocordyceps australis TaxID=1399860 RepID=A0A2C5ZSR6_9HYPO|nr:hypothetical protein CDD82_4508 [Ophiocordyceps australis]
MHVLSFTLSLEGLNAFRDALICLSKFSEDVSLEARRDRFTLTTINSSKSAYASFKFATKRFFSRYHFEATGQFRERFHCCLYIRSLTSLFRSRSGLDSQRDTEKQALIDRCEVTIEDGHDTQSRFIARIIFRNGLTATHRLPFEPAIPVHARFNKDQAPHHWTMSSRTLRQLMDHFGPGTEYLDINTDGDHVNFTCFSEKTTTQDTVLKKPLHTSIAVEVDEFDDIDVEDKLHIVISVKDFRAIIQHAGFTANAISARYSIPAHPIQFTYAADAISCEFLVMTVGDRASNPNQKTTKNEKTVGRKAKTSPKSAPQTMNAAAASDAPKSRLVPSSTSHMGIARASASRIGAFNLRPSQNAPPRQTLQSEGLFVEDDGWEPLADQDQDGDQDARLEWDHGTRHESWTAHLGRESTTKSAMPDDSEAEAEQAEASYIEPTQRLSDVKNMVLLPD